MPRFSDFRENRRREHWVQTNTAGSLDVTQIAKILQERKPAQAVIHRYNIRGQTFTWLESILWVSGMKVGDIKLHA